MSKKTAEENAFDDTTEMTPEEARKAWDEWTASRPPSIQELIKKFEFPIHPVWRMKSTQQVVVIYSFLEPEKEGDPATLRVYIPAKLNPRAVTLHMFGDRLVHGIPFEDLEKVDDEEVKRIEAMEPLIVLDEEQSQAFHDRFDQLIDKLSKKQDEQENG